MGALGLEFPRRTEAEPKTLCILVISPTWAESKGLKFELVPCPDHAFGAATLRFFEDIVWHPD